jgi:hypothetical protein
MAPGASGEERAPALIDAGGEGLGVGDPRGRWRAVAEKGGEGLAVRPGNALAEGDCAFSKVLVVLRIPIRSAIDDVARGEVDRP